MVFQKNINVKITGQPVILRFKIKKYANYLLIYTKNKLQKTKKTTLKALKKAIFLAV